jgi:hypothetical protein
MRTALATLTMLLGCWCVLMVLISVLCGLLCDAWDRVLRWGRGLLLLCVLLWLVLLW